jgi:hypothetical protein
MQIDTDNSTLIAHYWTGLLADNTYTGNYYLSIIFILQGKVKVKVSL